MNDYKVVVNGVNDDVETIYSDNIKNSGVYNITIGIVKLSFNFSNKNVVNVNNFSICLFSF